MQPTEDACVVARGELATATWNDHDVGRCDLLERAVFLAYVFFLGAFLYTVGFVGGFSVPTTLDGPASGSLLGALGVNIGLLTLFAVQHSVMARPWFKKLWTRLVPEPVERSTYVLFSSLALTLLFWQWRPMGGDVWSVDDPWLRTVLYALFTFGWALVLVSTFLIHHFDLFGLRQVWLHLRGRPYTPLAFKTPGPYRIVRHPLYVGWLFAFWITPTMTIAHLVFALATPLHILVAIRFEERDLVHQHGAAYEAYREAVPMLIPRAPKVRNALHARSSSVPASRDNDDNPLRPARHSVF